MTIRPLSSKMSTYVYKLLLIKLIKLIKLIDRRLLFGQGEIALKKLRELVGDLISADEKVQFNEWLEYLSTDNGAWILGNEHLDLFAQFLSDDNGKFAPNVPLLTLQALQAAALKDDFVLVLHQDRKDRRIMSYINRIEAVTLAEQEEITKLLCNLCSQPSSFDWLCYITGAKNMSMALAAGSNCSFTSLLFQSGRKLTASSVAIAESPLELQCTLCSTTS